MKEVTFEESLSIPNRTYIDVRSPSEYNEDHIPDSISIPLFDDTERSIIGTIYKLKGKDEAVIKGTEIVGPKLATMLAKTQSFKNNNLVILCARGGMRSSSVASLLSSLGYTVYRLDKGYKSYRRYIHNHMQEVPLQSTLYVLHGLTGTGKTAILEKLEHSLDLEGMAGHRSSLFGGLGLIQNSQKYFETLLFHRLQELSSAPYIIIEGESPKIGNLHIPPSLYSKMKSATHLLVTASLEERAAHIVEEYTKQMDDNRVRTIVSSLSQKLGPKNLEKLINFIDKKDYFNFACMLLEKYYDPLYMHSLKKMNFIREVHGKNPIESASQIIEIIKRDNKNYNEH